MESHLISNTNLQPHIFMKPTLIHLIQIMHLKILEVYSGSEKNWIKDTFDENGKFIKSNNLNVTQLSHLEPFVDLDLNSDGVIGNIIFKKFGPEYQFGSSHLIDQLKTYELMSGGYVLSKNDHPLNSPLRNLESDHHA